MWLFVTGSVPLLGPGEWVEPRRDQEAGGGVASHSWMVCLAAELFLNSCFSDTVFVSLLCTAVGTAFSEVHKLLHTGGVPTSLM